MKNNKIEKHNDKWLIIFCYTILMIVLGTILFRIFGFLNQSDKRNNVKDETSKTTHVFQYPSEQRKELSEFVAKYKNKFSILSVQSFEFAKNIFYYNKDGYLDVVPKKMYVEDVVDEKFYIENIKENELDIVKFLEGKQEEFDQESKSVLEEFQNGDAKSKVNLLSTERGKAHLIYRYNGNPGYKYWLNDDYLVLKIYYNPEVDSDINSLATSLDGLIKQVKSPGNILSLDLVDVNKENAVVLEDIHYSGDIKAVAYPVRVTEKYGMFERKEEQRQVNLSNNPEHIVDLMDYFGKSERDKFKRYVIPEKEN